MTRSDLPVARFAFHDYLLALFSGLLAFALYSRTLAPGLLFGDSAEFQMAAWLGSFVHPTGYPLYLLTGYLWTHLLPAGDPAWRMNLLSAVWAALAVGLVYLLALRIITLTLRSPAVRPGGPDLDVPPRSDLPAGASAAGRLAALFAALAFAITPTFWSQAVVAEVYSLNAVFVAAVLLGLTIWAAQPHASGCAGNAALYWTAAIYGLSLTHHRSMLLLIPAIGLFLWLERTRWANGRAAFHALARALVLVLLPLLLYIWIPLRAPHSPYATITIGPGQTLDLFRPTVDWFIGHVSGRAFGSSLAAPANLAVRLAEIVQLFPAEVSWVSMCLAGAGLIWTAARSRPVLALTGLTFLAVVAFNLSYHIGDIFVFYIPAYLIWILWAALGVICVSTLLVRAAAKFSPRVQSAVLLLPCMLILAAPAWSLYQRYDALDRSGDVRARSFWQTILAETIPEGAILVSNDRDEMVPLWYLQYVEGVRPDLTGLFPRIQPASAWADVGQVIRTSSGSGRPVLLIKAMPGLETRFRIEPAGSLARVVGPAASAELPPQHSLDVDFGGAIRLAGYDLEPAALRGGEATRVTLHWRPLRPLHADYSTFVHLINADGAVVGASDHLPGGMYYPSGLWQPGDTLLDTHVFTPTADLGSPPFSIEAGLYTSGPPLQHLGRPEIIGQTGAAYGAPGD